MKREEITKKLMISKAYGIRCYVHDMNGNMFVSSGPNKHDMLLDADPMSNVGPTWRRRGWKLEHHWINIGATFRVRWWGGDFCLQLQLLRDN